MGIENLTEIERVLALKAKKVIRETEGCLNNGCSDNLGDSLACKEELEGLLNLLKDNTSAIINILKDCVYDLLIRVEGVLFNERSGLYSL